MHEAETRQKELILEKALPDSEFLRGTTVVVTEMPGCGNASPIGRTAFREHQGPIRNDTNNCMLPRKLSSDINSCSRVSRLVTRRKLGIGPLRYRETACRNLLRQTALSTSASSLPAGSSGEGQSSGRPAKLSVSILDCPMINMVSLDLILKTNDVRHLRRAN